MMVTALQATLRFTLHARPRPRAMIDDEFEIDDDGDSVIDLRRAGVRV